MGGFDAGPRGVPLAELVGALPPPCGLQRLEVLPRLQADDARLELGPGAARAEGAGRAVLAGEARFPGHARLGVGVGQPRDALLAGWAGDDLPVPIDAEVGLGE